MRKILARAGVAVLFAGTAMSISPAAHAASISCSTSYYGVKATATVSKYRNASGTYTWKIVANEPYSAWVNGGTGFTFTGAWKRDTGAWYADGGGDNVIYYTRASGSAIPWGPQWRAFTLGGGLVTTKGCNTSAI